MALSCGFYNSSNKDRLYDTRQFSRLFNALIKDGVFSHIGDHLAVTASEVPDMNVNVGMGLAWFNSTWSFNDAVLPVGVEESDLLLTRIDALVLEINEENSVRDNAIKFIKGTPSAQPKKPELTNTVEVHQYALCYVTVKAGATSITQANIENNIGLETCPYVTGILETADITSLVAQWEAEFTAWFKEIEGQLGEDAAGNLQNQINNKVPYLYKATFRVDDWAGEGPYTQTVNLTAVDGGLIVNPNYTSVPAGIDNSLDEGTKIFLRSAAATIFKGARTLGNGTIFVSVNKKPTVDAEVYFWCKKGES